jgi:hypothetical protein
MKISVGEISDVQTGFQFRSGVTPEPHGSHLVIQAKDIAELGGHRLQVGDLVSTTPKGNSRNHVVRDGELLFLARGRRNYATVLEGLEGATKPAVPAGYFFILRPTSASVRPDYLHWAINQDPSQLYLKSMSRGSHIPFVPKQALMDLTIDVPDLATQELIVKVARLAVQEEALLSRLAKKKRQFVSAACMNAARNVGHMDRRG